MYQKKNYHQTSGSSFFFIVPTHRWQYASSLHHLLSSESRGREPSLRSASQGVLQALLGFRADLVAKRSQTSLAESNLATLFPQIWRSYDLRIPIGIVFVLR